MRRLLSPCALFIAIAAAMAGCRGTDSTVMQDDIRDLSGGIKNNTPGVYSGRAIDGYLRHARVWLDFDKDGQLDAGEPTAMTGPGGVFNLDVSGLSWIDADADGVVDDGEVLKDQIAKPLIDPRNYPLMLIAIPGVTVDESRMVDGNESLGLVDRAFFMMSPPGTNVVTPFTTLVETQRRIREFAETVPLAEQQALSSVDVRQLLVRNLNPVADFLVQAGPVEHLYAKTLAHYVAQQTPEALSELLRLNGCEPGACQGYSSEALIAISHDLLRRAPGLVDLADQAVTDAGAVAAVVLSELPISLTSIALDNPRVLVSREVTVVATQSIQHPPADRFVESEGSGVTAEFTYQYDTAGRLVVLEADGLLQPSIRWIAELGNQGGKIAALGPRQDGDDFVYQYNAGQLKNGVIDGRMEFDWDAGKVTVVTRSSFAAYPVSAADKPSAAETAAALALAAVEYKKPLDAQSLRRVFQLKRVNGRVTEVSGDGKLWVLTYADTGALRFFEQRDPVSREVLSSVIYDVGDTCANEFIFAPGGAELPLRQRITHSAIDTVVGGAISELRRLVDGNASPSLLKFEMFKENDVRARWHYSYETYVDGEYRLERSPLVSSRLASVSAEIAADCRKAFDADSSRRTLTDVTYNYQVLSDWLLSR